jgi:hypothetical protein
MDYFNLIVNHLLIHVSSFVFFLIPLYTYYPCHIVLDLSLSVFNLPLTKNLYKRICFSKIWLANIFEVLWKASHHSMFSINGLNDPRILIQHVCVAANYTNDHA